MIVILSLSHQPRKLNLPWSHSLPTSQLPDSVHKLQIRTKVLLREPRQDPPVVVPQVDRALDGPCKHIPAKGLYATMKNTKLARGDTGTDFQGSMSRLKREYSA